MDNCAPVRAWAPSAIAVGAAWVAASAALAWAALTADPAGRLLGAAAAVLLGGLALVGTAARPRLLADSDGVRVGRLTGSRRWTWAQVRRVEVVDSRRLGRRVGVLELDLADERGEHLVVLTRLDLDADPVEVAGALAALRYG